MQWYLICLIYWRFTFWSAFSRRLKLGVNGMRIYLAPHLLKSLMSIIFLRVFISVAHGGAARWVCKGSLGPDVVHNCGGFTGTGAVGATSSMGLTALRSLLGLHQGRLNGTDHERVYFPLKDLFFSRILEYYWPQMLPSPLRDISLCSSLALC